MKLIQRTVEFVENISRKRLFFLIAIYLLVAFFMWHLGMDIYYGEFNPLLRKDGPARLLASNVVEHGIFSRDGINPTGYAAPLYVLFVALLMKLFGSSYEWVLAAIQVVLAIIIGFFIFKITEKTFQSRTAGIISIILYSAHAELAFTFAFALREIGFFAFFLLLFIYVLMDGKLDQRKIILAAAIAALAALTRPTGVLLFGTLGLWIFYRSWKEKIKFFTMFKKFAIPAGLTFLLLVSPWLVYESYVLDSAVVTTSITSGTNLLMGNNPVTERIYPLLDMDLLEEPFENILDRRGLEKFVDEVAREKHLQKLAVTYIKENPDQFLKLGALKFFAFYSPLSTPLGHGEVVKKDGKITVENFSPGAINVVYFPFMLILYGGIILFFVYGIRAKIKTKTNFTKMAFLTLLIITLNHMVFIAESRHRFPFDPLLIIFAAGGYYYYYYYWKKSESVVEITKPENTVES